MLYFDNNLLLKKISNAYNFNKVDFKNNKIKQLKLNGKVK